MDRHEYEINQLINPKKDIVKSNSKHRDKIETLILGRRIGGISGGAAPPQKTNWKYENNINHVWFAGEILIEGDTSEVSVFGVNQSTYFVINAEGKIIGQNSNNVEMLLNEIKNAAELKTNKKVTSIEIIQSDYTVGNVLSDFDKYLDIS